MSKLLTCGVMWYLISIWGVLQLSVMSIFYYLEAVTLIEDVIEEEYEDYEDFIAKTKHNYGMAMRYAAECQRKTTKGCVQGSIRGPPDPLEPGAGPSLERA
ncbi:hypothetical protein PYW07_005901 [Mythimna separata]|uniref:Uncharacterized protein n=1 Tax=Mythimna separata TaxID=271217 RepID=A0AAD7YKT9_MYTSE|nr:hypothetical protein PYW07_005901 [Mythimna separata]